VGDKFFRILRFFAPTVCAIRRERGRIVRSLVRSLVRWRIQQRRGASANRCASSLSSLPFPLGALSLPPPIAVAALFEQPASAFLARVYFFPPPSILPRGRAVRASPARRRFYLITLLCFIEQLLRSRAVCFFFLRSLPETAVLVISGFNAVRASMVRVPPLPLPGSTRFAILGGSLCGGSPSVGRKK